MGIYAKWILPRLIDLCMRNREVERYRARIVPQARGRVLEVGFGSGLNLPFYGEAVQQLYGLDPSASLLCMGRERADGVVCPAALIECGAEAIPLEDGCIDTVVMTFTLCSVADPLRVLREIRRPSMGSRPRRGYDVGSTASPPAGATSPGAAISTGKSTR